MKASALKKIVNSKGTGESDLYVMVGAELKAVLGAKVEAEVQSDGKTDQRIVLIIDKPQPAMHTEQAKKG